VVDLEAAFTGEHRNLKVIEKLVSALSIPVQVGGGVRSVETARKLLDAGVTRVVLGTKAVESPELTHELVQRFGGASVAVSVDAKNGKIAIKGWTEVTDIDAIDFVRRVDQTGAGTIIYTDIATDGTLVGPNYNALEQVIAATRCDVISSGGVAHIEHVRRLARMDRIYGAILGRALYEGTIDLGEAVAIANAQNAAKGAV
jgi:phosphoribosylformimino-5-aminoimidazole carboxamide ribotide isomerase